MKLSSTGKLWNILTRCHISSRGGNDLPNGVTTGRHTYWYDRTTFQVFLPGAQIEVGGFCSIAAGASILAGSEHILTRPTTFPLNVKLFDPEADPSADAIDKGPTTIGNDVWIGIGATILSGVAIGDGAVIGAGAVVSKSVPPYAVVAGNPAQILYYRFDSAVRDRLLALRWWDWTDEEIRTARDWFMGDVTSFLDEMEQVHKPRAYSQLTRLLREMSPRELTPGRVVAVDKASARASRALHRASLRRSPLSESPRPSKREVDTSPSEGAPWAPAAHVAYEHDGQQL